MMSPQNNDGMEDVINWEFIEKIKNSIFNAQVQLWINWNNYILDSCKSDDTYLRFDNRDSFLNFAEYILDITMRCD